MKKNKTSKCKSMILFVLVSIISLFAVNASISFYTGNAVVKSFNALVDISDKADVTMTYIFSGDDNVNLSFDNVPESAKIMINGVEYGGTLPIVLGGNAVIIVKYAQEISKDAFKQFSINPNILFNGMANSNRLGSYRVQVIMPSNVKDLLSSSQEPTTKQLVDGRKAFAWNMLDFYASTLTISWHELNVDIEVNRIIPFELDDVFTVRNVLKNRGQDVSNIKLVQTYMEGDFIAVEPAEEFEVIQAGNDVRLEWKKEIPLLEAGASKEIAYKLRLRKTGKSVVFRPMHVYVNDNLVDIVERVEYNIDRISPLEFSIREAQVPQPVQLAKELPKIPENASSLILIPPQTEDRGKQRESEENGSIQQILQQPGMEKKISYKRNFIWTALIFTLLLIALLIFIYLNRRKNEGIRF